jgi:hypothetical protein
MYESSEYQICIHPLNEHFEKKPFRSLVARGAAKVLIQTRVSRKFLKHCMQTHTWHSFKVGGSN